MARSHDGPFETFLFEKLISQPPKCEPKGSVTPELISEFHALVEKATSGISQEEKAYRFAAACLLEPVDQVFPSFFCEWGAQVAFLAALQSGRSEHVLKLLEVVPGLISCAELRNLPLVEIAARFCELRATLKVIELSGPKARGFNGALTSAVKENSIPIAAALLRLGSDVEKGHIAEATRHWREGAPPPDMLVLLLGVLPKLDPSQESIIRQRFDRHASFEAKMNKLCSALESTLNEDQRAAVFEVISKKTLDAPVNSENIRTVLPKTLWMLEGTEGLGSMEMLLDFIKRKMGENYPSQLDQCLNPSPPEELRTFVLGLRHESKESQSPSVATSFGRNTLFDRSVLRDIAKFLPPSSNLEDLIASVAMDRAALGSDRGSGRC